MDHTVIHLNDDTLLQSLYYLEQYRFS